MTITEDTIKRHPVVSLGCRFWGTRNAMSLLFSSRYYRNKAFSNTKKRHLNIICRRKIKMSSKRYIYSYIYYLIVGNCCYVRA